jgi:Ca-activated chloride channel family protein
MMKLLQKNTTWRFLGLVVVFLMATLAVHAQTTPGGVANVKPNIPSSLFNSSAHLRLRNGDKNYRSGEYAKAETEYRKAIDRKPSPKGQYNLGNAIYQQKRFPEAIQHYNAASKLANAPDDKASALYNLGNAEFQAGKYEKSIDAYKNALRQNPADLESKFNLAVAQKKLQKQEEEKKKEQQDQKNQNQQQNQQNQPQNKNQNQQNQDKQQQQKDQQQQPQPEPDPSQKLSRKEAENLLKIMEDEERKVQSKLKRGFSQPAKSYKDW